MPTKKGKQYQRVSEGEGAEESPRSVAASYTPRSASAKASSPPPAQSDGPPPAAHGGESLRAYQGGGTSASVLTELGFLWRVAWPTAITTLLRAGTQQVTVMFVGHTVGAAGLGAVALGVMWVNISGLSIVFGGMSALDTLCSQAYGARNFRLVGLWAQRCCVCILCLCVPIFFLWFFGTKPVLHLMGIEPEIAEMAQNFTRIQVCFFGPAGLSRGP
eukprot:SAG22_NODE_1160_length_5317_cov_44.271560_3_plen_217_part_00